MTNYSSNPGSCLVSYFKPSGKWYMDEALDMVGFWDYPITPVDAVRAAIVARGGERLLQQFIAVVAEPYHRLAYPVMLIPEGGK